MHTQPWYIANISGQRTSRHNKKKNLTDEEKLNVEADELTHIT
jgi:hypothetical protein